MEQNGTTSPTQWEKVPFWEPESSAASVSPSTQTTPCVRRPAVAACAVGITPRRGEALVVCLWCSGRGRSCCCCWIRSLALEGLPAALLPLTASPSEPHRLMSARFNESFSILILFFFLVYLLIYGQRSIPFSLYYSVKHLNLSILLGFIPLKLKLWGSGGWRCCSEGREVHLKEKGMLPHLFFRFTLPLLKKNEQQPPSLTFFLFQYFLGVCIYNIFLKD